MATPTLADVRAVAVAWWREPGRPKLDVLRARIAALWTDPNAQLRVRIERVVGVWTLTIELERNGIVVTRQWTPQVGDRAEDLLDVVDDSASTLRERGEVP